MYCQRCALLSWNTVGNRKQIHIGFGPWNITWTVKCNLKICQSSIKKLMTNGKRDEKPCILELTKLEDTMENSMPHYIRSMVGLQACHSSIAVVYSSHLFRYLGTNLLWKHLLESAIKCLFGQYWRNKCLLFWVLWEQKFKGRITGFCSGTKKDLGMSLGFFTYTGCPCANYWTCTPRSIDEIWHTQ